MDVVQPDLHWCGSLTEAVQIHDIAEPADLKTVLHGANTPEGQHFSHAFPAVPMAEFHCSSPPGVPLAELVRLPGLPVPQDGFGLQIKEGSITHWRHGSR